MNAIKSLLMGCLIAAAAVCGPPALSAPQTGWWWNPAESGRGFFVESDGGITFIGAYLYDADGHARWLVSGSANPDPYNYTGELYAMHGGQTLFGGYVPPAGPDNAGTISVHFSDDTHGIVTWPGGTVAIERHIFGGTNAAFQPAPGWWWNADESGSGYSIEVQGDKLFLVAFMYDSTGRPVWYFSAGSMTSLTTYHGSLVQFANGQTLDGPYRPPGTPIPVGTVAIDFDAWDVGTLRFTDLSAANAVQATAAPLTREINLGPQFSKYVVGGPKAYLTKFLITQLIQNAFSGTLTGTFSGHARWDRFSCGAGSSSLCYFPTTGTVVVTVDGELVVGSIGKCHTTGVKTFTGFLPTATYLEIDGLNWRTSIELYGQMAAKTVCNIAGQTTSQTTVIDVGWAHSAKDRIIQNQIPFSRSLADGSYEEVFDVKGGFWEYYGITNPNGLLVESGYVTFFPITP